MSDIIKQRRMDMKSSQSDYKKRGMLDMNLCNQLQEASYKELIDTLQSSHADWRTACIHLLSKKYNTHPQFTDVLLQQLVKEKALYTKIEIQTQLSQYGQISKMCQYLGCIGDNQYRVIPLRGSKKKSYPLPRDLIARSLAHMEVQRFQDFFVELPQLSYSQLLEAIDAFGFLCFYHQSLVNKETYEYIKTCILNYWDDDLMLWKLMTCLSAFPMAIDLLQELQTQQKHPTILMEVERSLKLLIN